ncbi:hypothetical protein BS78_06G118600 [Paspalum vaginatum]|nr:hypothetical protein BS78_06G118600 [Paspalum vaginatum]
MQLFLHDCRASGVVAALRSVELLQEAPVSFERMATSWGQLSLEFGVRVVRVDGLELEEERGGGLFVRYYVPAGDGRRRLRVDTREVPCAGPLRWGELARFERWGTAAAAAGAPVAFELRWRPRPSSPGLAALLGAGARARPSRVLARAELPWADVAASAAQPAERWLALSPAGRELGGCKAPKLLVEVKPVRAAVAGDRVMETPPAAASGRGECCRAGERCGQCGWVGNEEDMFLAATFSQLS